MWTEDSRWSPRGKCSHALGAELQDVQDHEEARSEKKGPKVSVIFIFFSLTLAKYNFGYSLE